MGKRPPLRLPILAASRPAGRMHAISVIQHPGGSRGVGDERRSSIIPGLARGGDEHRSSIILGLARGYGFACFQLSLR
jgi:hypothetical protein